jgi:hypothetical protein
MEEREMIIRELSDLYLDAEVMMEKPLASLKGFTMNELLEVGRIEDVLDWIAVARDASAADV